MSQRGTLSRFSRASVVALLIAAVILPGASSQLTGTGLSVTLNDVNYFISPYSVEAIALDPSSLSAVDSIFGFTPITIVQDNVAQDELVSLFSNWTTTDDVFQEAFTGAVFLADASNNTSSTSYSVLPTNCTAPSGPYFVEQSTGALHQVYRLYDDFAGAFTTPLLQTPEGAFQPLSAQVAASATMTVGVPSRIYFTKTAEKPLAGVRIGVKVRTQP